MYVCVFVASTGDAFKDALASLLILHYHYTSFHFIVFVLLPRYAC